MLYFTQEADRQNIMRLIIAAKGFSDQLDQYEVVAQLGTTTLQTVHKDSGKSYVIKIISNHHEIDK